MQHTHRALNIILSEGISVKKLSFLFLLALILTFPGCAVKEAAAMEYVTDTLPEAAAPAYFMTAELPAGAMLSGASDEGRFAVFSHADYEVIEEIFPAASAEDAFLHVAGQTAAQLRPIKLRSSPREEYRFGWTAAGEEGTLSCSATVLLDGDWCYSVSIQCRAEKEKDYQKVFSALLSSVELQEI